MIKYIKRENIDIEKYDNCVQNAIQSRMYAFSWYLDIVAENWDVLVLNDYEAVMPLPWKKKYYLKHVSQPFFCQQLGIFSLNQIDINLQNIFLKKIPFSFLKVTQNLNAQNFANKFSLERKNYVLSLENNYNSLFKRFSKGRKHAVKVAQKNELNTKVISILDLIKLKEQFYLHSNFPKDIIEKLANYILSKNKGFIIGVFKDEKLLGGGFFLKSNSRITYLFSSFNNEGRKYQAASFLINKVIEDYQNSDLILDFEGGSISNIGSFFKSFGAKNNCFYMIRFNNISILNWN